MRVDLFLFAKQLLGQAWQRTGNSRVRDGWLETIGRKTGKPRRTPVGNGLVGKQFWIVV